MSTQCFVLLYWVAGTGYSRPSIVIRYPAAEQRRVEWHGSIDIDLGLRSARRRLANLTPGYHPSLLRSWRNEARLASRCVSEGLRDHRGDKSSA